MKSLLAIASFSFLAYSSIGHTATYEIEFTRSSYEMLTTDSFSDLEAAHNAGQLINRLSVDGFNNIDTQAVIDGDANNHSIMLTTSFYVDKDTLYDFQLGADWGRGGGIAIINADTNTIVSEQLTGQDIWWDNDWNNSDVINTNFAFTAGNWTIKWIGFEGCCSGTTSIRYSENGGAYAALTNATFNPPSDVPVPGAVILFSSALALLVARKKTLKAS
jgi:hypothetical protein